MPASFGASSHSTHVLIEVLRDAIENTTSEKAKRRLLLLVDAIEGELQVLTNQRGDSIADSGFWP